MQNIFFKIKDVDLEKGEFVGMASVAGNEDMHGDVIDKGAFKRTIDHKGNDFPLLWQHRTAEPIGIASVKEVQDGLEVVGKLNLAVEKAKEAFSLLKQKAIRGLSIGFEVVTESLVDSVNHIIEINLWEVSVVTFPANPLAQVVEVKSRIFETSLGTVIGNCEIIKNDGDKEYLERNKTLIQKAVDSLNALLTEDSLVDSLDDILEGYLNGTTSAEDFKKRELARDEPKERPEDKELSEKMDELSKAINGYRESIKKEEKDGK